MKCIKGSQTEKNLMAAFAGEGQARMRYTFWASQAKKEGYEQIADIFRLTADQEKEHAERFFKFLEGGECVVEGTYPAGVIGTTLDNLTEAAAGEHHEAEDLYPSFAKTADEEGYPEVAAAFRAIIVAERNHEQRYLDLAENIKEGRVFKRNKETVWQCRNCGYTYVGEEPPEMCPACLHAKAYYELKMNNW